MEGPQSVRHHVRIGERLPLDKGAPGKVILAFMGEKGKEYERIRCQVGSARAGSSERVSEQCSYC